MRTATSMRRLLPSTSQVGGGTRFLRWLQEELESLPSIVTGLMSYASLVTCEGAGM
jgi:ABC-type phosphate transport system permease subunit